MSQLQSYARDQSSFAFAQSVGNDKICEFHYYCDKTFSRANSTTYVHTFDTLTTFCHKVNLLKTEFQKIYDQKHVFRQPFSECLTVFAKQPGYINSMLPLKQSTPKSTNSPKLFCNSNVLVLLIWSPCDSGHFVPIPRVTSITQ